AECEGFDAGGGGRPEEEEEGTRDRHWYRHVQDDQQKPPPWRDDKVPAGPSGSAGRGGQVFAHCRGKAG
ncbi:hypothetical protein A2U01_0116429, partial [Trifolium medium]|nr:hypothetical protein [Trifolium medium]